MHRIGIVFIKILRIRIFEDILLVLRGNREKNLNWQNRKTAELKQPEIIL